MDVERGVAVGNAGQDVAEREALEELSRENARLRQLVGELLLKNQRLRDASSTLVVLEG